jgi:outer membrane lipoprotein-sorting protein
MMFASLLALSILRPQEDVTAFLSRVQETYSNMASYADTGTVVQRVGEYKGKKTFRTLWAKDRGFRFEYRTVQTQRENPDLYVVWGKGEMGKRYWSLTSDVAEGTLDELLNDADATALGAATPIFRLLQAPEDEQVPRLTKLGFPNLLPDEKVGGALCKCVQGSYGQIGVLIWVDPRSMLVVKMRTVDGIDDEVVEETEITYQPQLNPKLTDDKLSFSPPTRPN